MDRTIRTCSLIAALLAGASPAAAKVEITRPNGPMTFVGARAAELVGDPRRAAILYAALAQADPDNRIVANRAIGQAIAAGDTKLALQLIATRPPAELGVDARLLVAADRLAAGKEKEALAALRVEDSRGPDLGFLAPFVNAWAERRIDRSLDLLSAIPSDNAVAAFADEHRALLLIRARRTAEAEPYVARALANAGARASRLRIALSDGYMRAGDRARALDILAGNDVELTLARQLVAAGKAPGDGVTNAAEAYAELLTAVALELNRSELRSLPITMVQAARQAAPGNPTAPLLLGIMLSDDGRLDDALAVLRSVPEDDLFAAQAHDSEVRALIRAGREEEALARARAFASANPAASDWARVGDALDQLDRYDEAADAFGRAIALVERGSAGPELWQLHLLRGAMLERGKRWAEAKTSLQAARRLAPRNPLVLNYLGYAQLERGENLDQAEALIAEAHRLAPDDASITDSLGWAQFKRGRLNEAIATLQRAAAADPSETEIHEHLGDALYTAGRKFEARHAWRAALVTAEDDVKARIEAKIGTGLTPANAAP